MVDVSTYACQAYPQSATRFQRLWRLLDQAGEVSQMLEPEHLALRLNTLDELDAILGDLDSDLPETGSSSELLARATTLRSRFEAANERLYRAAHAEIALQGTSSGLRRWLTELARVGEAGRSRAGLSFDVFDEIVSGVLQLCRPDEDSLLPSPEMTAYQPTPARHILDLIAACRFSSDDVFVDLGSGLGHVPLLVRILTGVPTRGVEVQPQHAASARDAAQRLNLDRVRFVAEDARMTDLSEGTVFYLFTPFRGSILAAVVQRLREQSKRRQIRICALGPCTRFLQNQTWLAADGWPDAEKISVFTSL